MTRHKKSKPKPRLKENIVPAARGESASSIKTMRDHPIPVTCFGELGLDFDDKVFEQMNSAARLPVAERAAIMPDGHLGYALPIGGVIGLDNAVSPSFVGYDIACRMTLTILDIPVQEFSKHRKELARDMQAVSRFGVGAGFRSGERHDHPVMADPLWHTIPVLKTYQSLAHEQLGTSGGGNHFFDAVLGEVTAEAEWMPLPVGKKFVAVMTHSGSRGAGNKLAQYYVTMAKQEIHHIARGIPSGYEWLPLDSEAGVEYWEVMQLMGRYARANHHLIHDAFLARTKLGQVARWENHHNFAFIEDGLVVHRKGATPAQKGKVGIIPGSSGTPSYLVEGLGFADGLKSSSHGAGRNKSRHAAARSFDQHAFDTHMHYHDILSIGVAKDETYMSYKDIERVMSLQEGILVRSIARMQPMVVIMGGGHADDGD
jgi:tRNA-splicing ligase RtcB (3'-phosphate/5'-hydroxy nucleic acid ligase)